MATLIINNAQPCGLEHIKKCYLHISDTAETLSIKAKTLPNYREFDITLLDINFKFVQGSLSSVLDALVNYFYKLDGVVLIITRLYMLPAKKTLKYSNARLNLIFPLSS